MNQTISDKPPVSPAVSAEKKAYHAPCFKAHGAVGEITETNAFSGNGAGDGGTFPNNYNS